MERKSPPIRRKNPLVVKPFPTSVRNIARVEQLSLSISSAEENAIERHLILRCSKILNSTIVLSFI